MAIWRSTASYGNYLSTIHIMSSNPIPSTVAISVNQAQQQIQDAIIPVSDYAYVNLDTGLNRVLGRDIIAAIDVPAFDNSAMDGFAFRATDLESCTRLTVVGLSYAGHPFQGQLQFGQAIRITTGAPMPEYADSVLPQEFAIMEGETTLVMDNMMIRPGQNRRRRGENIAAGSKALSKGTRLGPAELGVLASVGLATIPVQRKLRVAIFSTGDELRDVGQQLDSGSVYDSNRVTLQALLTQFGTEVVDLGVIPDNEAAMEAALKQSANQVDVIITSGGVAAGAADFTKSVMKKLGRMNFWSIKMRPGRPLAFGSIAKHHETEKTYVFGLPGNPVAMMVSFYFFVRPALQLLSGSHIVMPPTIPATATQAIDKKAGRTEFQRGIHRVDAQGKSLVSITGDQGSAMLSSMALANCFVMMDSEQENICAGDTVKIMLFDGLN
jgi:molybdopterin molybdotransferase